MQQGKVQDMAAAVEDMAFCSKYYDGSAMSPIDPSNDFIAFLSKQASPEAPAPELHAAFFGPQGAPVVTSIAAAEDVVCIATSQYIDESDES